MGYSPCESGLKSWVGQFASHFEKQSDGPELPLWQELYDRGRASCQRGRACSQWPFLLEEQRALTRQAYRSLRKLERELPDGHPAVPLLEEALDLLQAVRECLPELARQFRRLDWMVLEGHLNDLRKLQLALQRRCDGLEDALASPPCSACEAYSPAHHGQCQFCGQILDLEESWDIGEGEEVALPPAYAELGAMIERQDPRLRQQAELLRQQLVRSRGPICELDSPALVAQLLHHLGQAERALESLSRFDCPASLSSDWAELVDQLVQFERLLLDYEDSESPAQALSSN